MKTVEVIDLLSSPVPATFPSHRATPPSNTNLQIISSRLAEATSSRPIPLENPNGDDEWLLLSDDGDALPPLPKLPSIKPPPKNGLTAQSNPWRAPVGDFGSDDFWSFGKDAASISKSTEQSVPDKEISKQSDGFFFLSDDFDSSVNLSKTYAGESEPVSKKRKISPKPEQRISMNPTTGNSKRNGLERASSDMGAGSKGGPSSFGTKKSSGLKRTNTTILDDDPILFTSSPDILTAAKAKRNMPMTGRAIDLLDDPILFTSSPDIVRAAKERREKARRNRDLESNDECDDVSEGDPFGGKPSVSYDAASSVIKSTTGTKKHVTSYLDEFESSSDIELPDIIRIDTKASTYAVSKLARKEPENRHDKYNTENTAGQKEKIAAQKAVEKLRKAQERLESKDAEKERKRQAKEEKAFEKQLAADIAKVNQKRTEKKISTPEMIVDLPLDLEKNVAKQVRRLLEPLGCDCEDWDNSIPNVIRWRRKIEALYNEDLGHWEPTAKHVKVEKQVMCIMGAKEFVELACGDEGHDLSAHVGKMKAKFSGFSIIYLIEGLTGWQRKNKNIKNRQFTEAVRSQMEEGLEAGSSSQRPKKKKKQLEYIDADMIEDALLSLQVVHGALIHHTGAAVETAEWIVVFTQHISTAPYRQQQMTLDTAFCMDSGQVKTGEDASDTFVKMLQEVQRITAPIAYGIATEYPSVQKLVAGFEKHGKTMLQNVRKTANKDGALTDREIGTRMSHRVYGIFMGRDERSTDV